MYKLFNFNYNLAALSSSETSYRTSSPKLKKITLCTFSKISSLSLSDRDIGRTFLPFKTFARPWSTSRACIFTHHRPKSFSPLNFSTSNLAVVISFALIPVCYDKVTNMEKLNVQENEINTDK
ncbi:hypothetical protein TorRG33x02_057370 [Trema orientale]|uniref:Uncharacterized protein n=1 Tax=Trema orientale TaxID=63057 RepID=A0A2P5FL70_TREOI|nr:hypothetical protein TorRG33x02_057370 [Trema orientale]